MPLPCLIKMCIFTLCILFHGWADLSVIDVAITFDRIWPLYQSQTRTTTPTPTPIIKTKLMLSRASSHVSFVYLIVYTTKAVLVRAKRILYVTCSLCIDCGHHHPRSPFIVLSLVFIVVLQCFDPVYKGEILYGMYDCPFVSFASFAYWAVFG